VITNYKGQYGFYASRPRVMEIERKKKIAEQLAAEHNGSSET
jgi:hypothetical protein